MKNSNDQKPFYSDVLSRKKGARTQKRTPHTDAPIQPAEPRTTKTARNKTEYKVTHSEATAHSTARCADSRHTDRAAAAKPRPAQKARGEKNIFAFKPIGSVFARLPSESRAVLENFDEIVQSVRPLNSKQFLQLPYAVRDLSHLLTDERGSRRAGYMNGTAELSAYIRYFHWWNLFRLSAVFAGLARDAFDFLQDGDALLDIGSGPLTVPQALWLSRPELRCKKLTFYALDTSPSALSVGEELFLSLAARLCTNDESPWTIVRVKGAYGTPIRKKAAAVFCANMFNELYQNSARPIEEDAKYCAKELRAYGAETCALFVAEPGIPRSARFVSLMRDAFLRAGAVNILPCVHDGTCACPGTKNAKWCHFVQNTEAAPEKLRKLSDSAFLHKERATLSFVFATFTNNGTKQGTNAAAGKEQTAGGTSATEKAFGTQNDSGTKQGTGAHGELIRVMSDEIALPRGECGKYGCSAKGLVLLTGSAVRALSSGTLIAVTVPKNTAFRTDEKSGARIVPIG